MSGLWCGLVGENKFCICTCGLLFAGYSIPQVADRWLAGLELSVFQKVTQKVWFVVLVGLLLGLACGAVMARWPGLRPTAAGVAVVGALLLGRVVGWLRQVVLGLATGLLAVATAPFARRFGVSELTWAIGLGFLVGAVWRIVGAMRRRGGSECGHACAVCALSSGDVKLSKQYHRSPGVMCPDTGQPCTKGCDATAKPCDRNGSVHPNSVPPIDENAQIERLARLLHDAGRSAVEPSGAFVEWDDAPERTRAGRRSQAQYLLAAGVVLPGDSALDRIAADVAELRRLAEPAKLTIPPGPVTADQWRKVPAPIVVPRDNSARPAEPTSGLTVTVSANETAADVAKRLPEYFRVTVDGDLEIIHQIPTTNVVIAPSAADREAAAK